LGTNRNDSTGVQSLKRALSMGLLTFGISIFFVLVSTSLLITLNLTAALLVLLAIVITGVIFDIMGVAATAATERPFHAMASKRVKGANEALRLVRNADKVASFCADVIGDISGTVAGGAAAAIVFSLITVYPSVTVSWGNVVMIGTVAALTVGGKAGGKIIAISRSHDIIYRMALIMGWWERLLGIKIVDGANSVRRK